MRLVLISLSVAGARLLIGSTGLEVDPAVVGLRGHRLLLAAAAGGLLAVSGVCLQGLLRNPLAEPFLLGLSGGAAAGALLGVVAVGGHGLVPGGLIGAVAVTGLVYGLGRRDGRLDPLTVLLVGVVLSTLAAAVVLLISELSGPLGSGGRLARATGDVRTWMLGALNTRVRPWHALGVLAGLALLIGWLRRNGDTLDAATHPDTEAASLGVDVPRVRTCQFAVAATTATAAVALAGPVAFIGLIGPHLARGWVGASHRRLVPVSATLGAVLLVAADTASSGAAAVSAELGVPLGTLPPGLFMAVLGGGTLLVLLPKMR